jgi:drug/metabolite transporter (DMT)-like permease
MTAPADPAAEPQYTHDVVRGVAWAFVACIMYGVVPIGVRLLSDTMPATEIVFVRNFGGLTIFFTYFAAVGFGRLRTRRFGAHVVRNFMNFTGMVFWFAALAVMPLGQAVALHFTIPLMAMAMAIMFLGERPGPARWFAAGVGIVGVVLILRPGVVAVDWAAGFVLLSALLYAGTSTYTRALGRTDEPSVTTFYYLFMLALFSVPFALANWALGLVGLALPFPNPDWVLPTADDIVPIAVLVGSGTLAPYCLIRAFKLAESSLVSPVEFIRLPFTAGFAWWLFGEVTDAWTWTGAGIIFAATWYMTWVESQAGRRTGH